MVYLYKDFFMNSTFSKTTALLLLSMVYNSYSATVETPFEPATIVMETERLVLRLVDTADVHDFFAFTSDPEVVKHSGAFTLHTDCEETSTFIHNKLNRYVKHTQIPWAIVYKPENKVIGIIMLFYNAKHHKAELGYAVSRAYWGFGIATEAAQAVVDFGFSVWGLHRIDATFDPRNGASGRVLEKCGFKYEGLLRDYYFLSNELCDRVITSILKNEYRNETGENTNQQH